MYIRILVILMAAPLRQIVSDEFRVRHGKEQDGVQEKQDGVRGYVLNAVLKRDGPVIGKMRHGLPCLFKNFFIHAFFVIITARSAPATQHIFFKIP